MSVSCPAILSVSHNYFIPDSMGISFTSNTPRALVLSEILPEVLWLLTKNNNVTRERPQEFNPEYSCAVIITIGLV